MARKDFDDGSSMTWETDNRRNTITSTFRDSAGSLIWETKDRTTGDTLNRAGLNPDGSRILYETGKYADEAFRQADVTAVRRLESTRDWKQNSEAELHQFRHQQQEELDKQLLSQMKGGKPVEGNDLIISGRYTKQTRKFEQEGSQQPHDWGETGQTKSDYEIRQVKPGGGYEIKPLGNPVAGKGWGETPSEALANAIDEASEVVVTKIESDMIQHRRSTRAMQGDGETRWSAEERLWSDMEASSFVVFKDYLVERVGQTEDGGSKDVTFPDGTTTTVAPDGTTVTTYPDGTTVTDKQDGKLHLSGPHWRGTRSGTDIKPVYR